MSYQYIQNDSDRRIGLVFRLMEIFRDVDNLSSSLTETQKLTEIDNIIKNRLGNIYDKITGDLSIGERDITKKFFEIVIDQVPHFRKDHPRIRKFIIDWYSANKTLVSSTHKFSDPYFFTHDELNELLKSLGFPYAYKILSKQKKVTLLYNFVSFIQRKGTPRILYNVLSLFNLDAIVLSEWWLHKDLTYDSYTFKSSPIFPLELKNVSEHLLEQSFSSFIANDVYWQQTEDDLDTAYESSLITLPSITPYLSLSAVANVNTLLIASSIISRRIKETYDYWVEYVLHKINDVSSIKTDPSTITTKSIGDRYLIGTSAINDWIGKDDKIAQWSKVNGVETWRYYTPEKNNVIFIDDEDTHFVYNGTAWVDLLIKLPSSILNSTKSGQLNRDVSLNLFKGSFSLFELCLVIDYIFGNSNTSDDAKFYQYDGKLKPFDQNILQGASGYVSNIYGTSGYSGYSGFSGYSGIRDDIPDNDSVYGEVYSEYAKLSQHDPTDDRDDRDSNYSTFIDNFTVPYDKTNDVTNISYPLLYSGVFLEAINKDFKDTIDSYLSYMNNDTLLENIMLDFENYLETQRIIELPFTFLTFGTSLLTHLKDILDYFKPKRARFTSMITKYGINDPIGDYMALKDTLKNYMYIKTTDELDINDELDKIKIYHKMEEGCNSLFDYFDSLIKDDMCYTIRQKLNELYKDIFTYTDKEKIKFCIDDRLCSSRGYLDKYSPLDTLTIYVKDINGNIINTETAYC